MFNWWIFLLAIIVISLTVIVLLVSRAPSIDEPEVPSLMPEDLDQYERDYYDRQSEKHLQGCLFSGKAWLIGTVIFLIGMWLFACGPKPYALLPEAIPMKQDGDRVLGVFQSLEGSPERYHAQWFYFPGYGLVDPHRYRIRVILERIDP